MLLEEHYTYSWNGYVGQCEKKLSTLNEMKTVRLKM